MPREKFLPIERDIIAQVYVTLGTWLTECVVRLWTDYFYVRKKNVFLERCVSTKWRCKTDSNIRSFVYGQCRARMRVVVSLNVCSISSFNSHTSFLLTELIIIDYYFIVFLFYFGSSNPDLRYSLCIPDEEKYFLNNRKCRVYESMCNLLDEEGPQSLNEVG